MIYGMSSFPTDELHHFSRWLLHHQPAINYGHVEVGNSQGCASGATSSLTPGALGITTAGWRCDSNGDLTIEISPWGYVWHPWHGLAWEIFRIREIVEVPTIDIFGLYKTGLNFREYPHNSYGQKYGTFTYLHKLDPEIPIVWWVYGDTVDRRNPAPVDRLLSHVIPLFCWGFKHPNMS